MAKRTLFCLILRNPLKTSFKMVFSNYNGLASYVIIIINLFLIGHTPITSFKGMAKNLHSYSVAAPKERQGA